MWLAVKSFLMTNALRLVQLGVIVLTVLLVLAGAKSAGKTSEKAKQYERAIKDAKRAKDIRRDVRAGDVPKRVRKFYID